MTGGARATFDDVEKGDALAQYNLGVMYSSVASSIRLNVTDQALNSFLDVSSRPTGETLIAH